MNSSVKSARRSMESQSLDAQRHFAIDLGGNLKRISMMRSVGIVSEFPFESGDRVLRRDIVRAFSAACCRRVFMADTMI